MTRVRLGVGDFVPKRAPNPHGRMAYLWAVSQCVPEALRELMRLNVEDDRAVRHWAAQWGFTDAWALSAALLHVPYWRETPDRLPVGDRRRGCVATDAGTSAGMGPDP